MAVAQGFEGFSLERFEVMAYSRDREMGMRELVTLLKGLDANYGGVGQDFRAQPLQSLSQQEVDQHLWVRLAAAISCLLSDKDLFIAPEWQQQILSYHRWLSALFSATPFRNADHVMRALNLSEQKDNLQTLQVAHADLLRFAMLYTPESEVPLDLDAFWESNPVLTAGLCLVLLSPRFLGSPAAHGKREIILPWLTERLDQIPDIELLPLGVLHDLYMHCSYADRADKHAIKKPINTLIKRKLAQLGLQNSDFSGYRQEQPADERPVMLVVLEWFTSAHSIYRTHSLTMEHARDKFRVVAMAYPDCVDETTLKVFDDFVPLDRNGSIIEQLTHIQKVAKEQQARVCYMPSVGMFPLTMWLANLRVAPLQLMALGHPATTHSQEIDFVVVEEDYVGSDRCFSEALLKLPSDGMPYRPSAAAAPLNLMRQPKTSFEKVHIAMCGTTMKLNPRFLEACVRIAQNCPVPVHFHFLIGQAQGLTYPSVKRVVQQYLGDFVTVYPHQNYANYMQVISGCDMFINPFPFGNTNGIVDTVSAGLVGVCKTGPEVHEHIDEGMFRRLGFPERLITRTEDDYVKEAIRLAVMHEEREALSRQLAGPGKVDVLFQGRPEIFGQMIQDSLAERGWPTLQTA